MTKPLVSILVAVHNGAALINETIASVVAQSFGDWIMFVVDNASVDGTREIVGSWMASDSRIRLIEFDEFVGGNENHERGFRLIANEAKYCKVLEADDLLFSDCLERMVSLAERFPSVGVVGAYRVSGDMIDMRELPIERETFDGREILCRTLRHQISVTGAPTSLLIRSDLIAARNPFWDCSFEHTDKEAPLWCFTQADFGMVHNVLTFTRRQSGTRAGWSTLINTRAPEDLRLLLRYGPSVLPDYRRQLRRELRDFLWFHLRQRVRPDRRRDEEFHRFHRDALDAIVLEAHGNPEVRLAAVLIRSLLRNGDS
jgi:glycosyltransferase involved in cell wall biosynthesis